MATDIWPLENGQKTINKKHPDRFRTFSHVFARLRPFSHFSLVSALFGMSVSDHFWPSVFALFRTIRLLPFSGCHLDSNAKTWNARSVPWTNCNRTEQKATLCFSACLRSFHMNVLCPAGSNATVPVTPSKVVLRMWSASV